MKRFDCWLDHHALFVIAAAVTILVILAFGNHLGLL